MSFILDALQRAQNARDQQTIEAAPIQAQRVHDAPANPRSRTVLASAALVGIIGIALTAWMLGRGSAAPNRATASPLPPPSSNQPAPRTRLRSDPMVDQGQVRALNREAARAEPTPESTATPRPLAGAEADDVEALAEQEGLIAITPTPGRRQNATADRTVTAPAQTQVDKPAAAERPLDEGLPEYENMLLGGRINLPNLRLDMHVFHDSPERRFVFINFKKYREGDAIDGDTEVEGITTRGAVLNHNGQRFVLRPN
ncbi:MAG: general secretion pathway protein GspB [Pseudomonadota bacterium]